MAVEAEQGILRLALTFLAAAAAELEVRAQQATPVVFLAAIHDQKADILAVQVVLEIL